MQRRHNVWEDGTSRGITIHDWSIETRKKPILNASEIDEASERLSIPLPEITFGNNLVSLRKKGKARAVDGPDQGNDQESESSLVFNGLDALALVDTTGEDNVKVAYADKWAQSRNLEGGSDTNGGIGVIETVKNFDWTYSNSYAGTSSGKITFEAAPPDHPGIPLAKLARTDEPILFYDDVVLFEDELHDNGIANLSVKIRIMPSSFFLLSRFFLRVDNVLFRIFDVRLYHDFASNQLIRETKGKEASYSSVKKRLPRERPDDLTPLTDSNWVANILGMLENDRSKAPAGASGTSAPWTFAAAAPDRRQIAPGISIPQRSPAPPMAPSIPRPETVEDKQEEGKKAWKGIGTKLEVAYLA